MPDRPADPLATLADYVRLGGSSIFAGQREAHAALAAVERLVEAARPALDLLAVEGYDRHHEGGFPVCAEYENLRAALALFEAGADGAASSGEASRARVGSPPRRVTL